MVVAVLSSWSISYNDGTEQYSLVISGVGSPIIIEKGALLIVSVSGGNRIRINGTTLDFSRCTSPSSGTKAGLISAIQALPAGPETQLIQYHSNGLTTSTDQILGVYNTAGFADFIELPSGSVITQCVVVGDNEQADNWSAGTMQIRLYSQSALLADSGALTNSAQTVFGQPITSSNRSYLDLSSAMSLPYTTTSTTRLFCRATCDGSFPAIDSEIGVEVKWYWPS